METHIRNCPKLKKKGAEDSQLHACDGGNAPSRSAGTQQCSSTVGGTDSFISVQETSLATVACFFPRMDTGLPAPQSFKYGPRLPFNLCVAPCGPMPCTCLRTSASDKLPSVHVGAQQDGRKRCDGAIGRTVGAFKWPPGWPDGLQTTTTIETAAASSCVTTQWPARASRGQPEVSCVMRRSAFWLCRLPKSRQWRGCTIPTAGVRRRK